MSHLSYNLGVILCQKANKTDFKKRQKILWNSLPTVFYTRVRLQHS